MAMRTWERLARATLGGGYEALVAGGRAVRRAAKRHRVAAGAVFCLFLGFAAGVLWPLRGPWPPAAVPPAGPPAVPEESRAAAGRESEGTTAGMAPGTPRPSPSRVSDSAPAPAPASAPAPSAPPRERLQGPGDFRRPLAGKVTAGFGWRRDPVFGDYRFHPGVDLQGRPGQEVTAAAAGQVGSVRSVGSDYGSEPAGWEIAVTHPGGWLTRYRFSGFVRVGAGQSVGRGEPLGTLAAPGLLHFALYRGEEAQQPALSASPEG
ncbi:MAG TPA: M23 family metallopeptidase [Firmicutes bacterium]|nr:M23 family metallopeptidase [Bacillota bacterium]